MKEWPSGARAFGSGRVPWLGVLLAIGVLTPSLASGESAPPAPSGGGPLGAMVNCDLITDNILKALPIQAGGDMLKNLPPGMGPIELRPTLWVTEKPDVADGTPALDDPKNMFLTTLVVRSCFVMGAVAVVGGGVGVATVVSGGGVAVLGAGVGGAVAAGAAAGGVAAAPVGAAIGGAACSMGAQIVNPDKVFDDMIKSGQIDAGKLEHYYFAGIPEKERVETSKKATDKGGKFVPLCEGLCRPYKKAIEGVKEEIAKVNGEGVLPPETIKEFDTKIEEFNVGYEKAMIKCKETSLPVDIGRIFGAATLQLKPLYNDMMQTCQCPVDPGIESGLKQLASDAAKALAQQKMLGIAPDMSKDRALPVGPDGKAEQELGETMNPYQAGATEGGTLVNSGPRAENEKAEEKEREGGFKLGMPNANVPGLNQGFGDTKTEEAGPRTADAKAHEGGAGYGEDLGGYSRGGKGGGGGGFGSTDGGGGLAGPKEMLFASRADGEGPMKIDDPTDYFDRTGVNENLFKNIARRYKEHGWDLLRPGALQRPAGKPMHGFTP